jgi:ABC-type bacteriocin/lantibiotic exporter with double-glycine peptidase domain
MKNLRKLVSFLPRRRHLQIVLLMLVSVASSLVEAAAVGSILPFIAVLQDPEIISAYTLGKVLQEWLGSQLKVGVTLIFCITVLLASAMRIFLVWAGSRVSQGAGSDIGAEIFRRTIYQPYSVHITRSSNELVNLLSTGLNALTGDCLLPSVNLIASLFVIVAIGTLLLMVDPVVAITVVFGIGSLYALLALLNRHRLDRLGVQSAIASREKIRTIQESSGGMRDVLINAIQPSYFRHFIGVDAILNHSRTGIRVLSQFPRYLIEAVGLVIVATMAYRMSDVNNLSSSIVVLGTFAIGAQRTLPAIQSVFSSWASIRNSSAYVSLVLKYLEDTAPAPSSAAHPVEPLRFQEQIKLESVSFRYSENSPLAINSVSLTIPKGARLGIIGPSGSGKSTLVDILMGLLEPIDGALVIDGVEVSNSNRSSWQSNLSHVPQTVFISEGSIEENIAFGIAANKIDWIRVREAARMAQIHNFIESLPDGYATAVGERGIRLSGGQRQRIGIARALYRQCNVLVLDEATSALDNDTEFSVMRAVDQLSKQLTIILIAHRLTTLKGCDFIVQINNGKIERQGTYETLVEAR